MFGKEKKLLDYILGALQISGSEIPEIELKMNNITPDEVGREISAIANHCALVGKEVGYIVFGIEDGTFLESGVSFNPFDPKVGNQSVELTVRNAMVAADFQFMPFEKDGKMFLIIEVYKALGAPATYKRDAWIRVGSNSVELKRQPVLEKRLWATFRKGRFWGLGAKADLSFDEVARLLDLDVYYSRLDREVPEVEKKIQDFLDEGLIVQQANTFGITNLGATLFARDIRNFPALAYRRPRVITYNGDTKLTTVVKDWELTSGYAVGFDALIEWVHSQIPEPATITGTVRVQKVTYPPTAIREIVANALIHQDFQIEGARPVVEIYKSHLEVTSPGASMTDPAHLIEAISRTRNERVADLMRRLHICEMNSTGIDRVVEQAEILQLPAPRFENVEESFKASLFSHRPFDTLTEEERLRALYQHVVLHYWLKRVPATNPSIRERFGIEAGQNYVVTRLINKAKESGLIKDFDPSSKSRKYTKYVPVWA